MIDLCLPDSLTPLTEVRICRIVAEPYNSRVGGRGPWARVDSANINKEFL